MTVHKNPADVLGAMVGSGVYDVAMIDDLFGPFGFKYDADTDQVVYAPREHGVPRYAFLNARSPDEQRAEMANDAGEGFVDARANGRVFDALALSQAIVLLVTQGAPPSLSYTNRSLGFKADVKALDRWYRQN